VAGGCNEPPLHIRRPDRPAARHIGDGRTPPRWSPTHSPAGHRHALGAIAAYRRLPARLRRHGRCSAATIASSSPDHQCRNGPGCAAVKPLDAPRPLAQHPRLTLVAARPVAAGRLEECGDLRGRGHRSADPPRHRRCPPQRHRLAARRGVRAAGPSSLAHITEAVARDARTLGLGHCRRARSRDAPACWPPAHYQGTSRASAAQPYVGVIRQAALSEMELARPSCAPTSPLNELTDGLHHGTRFPS
jgi:hypothetical protein